MGSIITTDNSDVLQLAGDTFRRGGVLLYPTMSLYGLGGDPNDARVSARIHAVKGTLASKPHLILTDEWERTVEWMTNMSELHHRLMAAAEHLVMTILFHAGAQAPSHLVGASGLLAVRKTQHPFCRALIRSVDSVLTSTSANRTGHVPPAAFDDIDPDIRDEVDIVVNGGPCSGIPSTMVAVQNDKPVVLRGEAASLEVLMARLELAQT